MPELAEAVRTVNNMGFLDPAVDILRYHNLMNERKYETLKKSIREKTVKGTEKALRGIERYIAPKKAAAIILGILGIILLILPKINITGNVIKNFPTNTTSPILGIFFLIVALVLFLVNLKNKSRIN